jgi:hypothetical protein
MQAFNASIASMFLVDHAPNVASAIVADHPGLYVF